MSTTGASGSNISPAAPASSVTPTPAHVKRQANRRPSFPSASSKEILSSVDEARPRIAIVKHGKYTVLGLGGIWYTGLGGEAGRVLGEEEGWVRKTLLAAMGSHVLTVLIFLYLVLFLPWFRGYIPNYPRWQQSARLRVLVPVLTATILIGWTCYVVSLSQSGKRPLQAIDDAVHAIGDAQPGRLHGEGIGVMRAMAGTTALYTLTLGVLGFIPIPSGVPVRKKVA